MSTEQTPQWAFDVVKEAMTRAYRNQMPEGWSIYLVAEYDPQRFSAPNLMFEKQKNPDARYVAILISSTESVPALGETVADAVEFALSKIETRQ